GRRPRQRDAPPRRRRHPPRHRRREPPARADRAGESVSTTRPGLVDLQVNGYAGHDVNADDVTVETITALTRALWAAGVTTYLPTVITASEDKIRHVLSVIAAARRSDPLLA